MTQTVLIIDDSRDIHRLIEHRLRSEKLIVYCADSGEAGIEIAKKTLPDLILLDVTMPDMHGFAVCRRLKEDIATASIPVIFLTAAYQTLMKVKGFELGAIDYITKPFEPCEMRARVRAALRMKRQQDTLAARAQFDGLTGLRNRSYFDERLESEMAAVERYQRAVSLVFVDLDHFKGVNDTHGHAFGDRMLQRVSEAVMSTLRSVDVACRYGGEEIVVILTETDLDGAVCAAERMRQTIEELRVHHDGIRVTQTASFGVACSEHLSHPSAAALLDAADKALYRAKRAGRNRVLSAPMTPRQRERAPRHTSGTWNGGALRRTGGQSKP